MFTARRGTFSLASAVVAALCLAPAGCESLRNHPAAGDHPPSIPWENTRLTTPPDAGAPRTVKAPAQPQGGICGAGVVGTT
jgi:hypothetical protein